MLPIRGIGWGFCRALPAIPARTGVPKDTAVRRFFSALGWFGKRGPNGADRRGSPRYPVVENQGQLAWREGEQVRYCFVRVLNISQGGVEVRAEQSPGLNEQVWLRLAAPSATEWVEGQVIRITK